MEDQYFAFTFPMMTWEPPIRLDVPNRGGSAIQITRERITRHGGSMTVVYRSKAGKNYVSARVRRAAWEARAPAPVMSLLLFSPEMVGGRA